MKRSITPDAGSRERKAWVNVYHDARGLAFYGKCWPTRERANSAIRIVYPEPSFRVCVKRKTRK